ncbi:MAG TPA: YbaK/EbsC family protein, partial [bacterium]|nr:YbaK/EbsC family protein [bacterium]
EIRPRFGLMRGREFIMKDGYSFDRTEEEAHRTYDVMYDAYKRIFTRCGLGYRPVEATTGTIGGSRSHEFQVLAESGEDEIVSCDSCEYAANVEKAEVRNSSGKSSKKSGSFEKVHTPGHKSVEDVSAFLKCDEGALVKTLIFDTDLGPVAGLVRGDRSLKESKLKEAIGCEWCHLADEDTVRKVTGASSGFSGPVGLKIPVYADNEIASLSDFVVGANEDDQHLVGSTAPIFISQNLRT